MCGDLPCTAKILHCTLLNLLPQELQELCESLSKSVNLLSATKHPCIVQYLGTYHDPELRLAVVLKELINESLTRFLE